MLRARLLIWLLTTGTCVRSLAAWGAPSGSVSVEVAAGHDDNMFLATAPLASEPLLRLGGWFAGVSPTVIGGLVLAGNRLQVSYAGDLRQSDAVGRLIHQEGELLFLSAPLGPLRLHLVALAGRFDASRHPDDHFELLGGEGGARLTLGQALGMRVRYHAERRWLGADGATSDMLHLVEAKLPWSVAGWLEIGPHASLLRVHPQSAPSDAAFQRLRAGLQADLVAGPLHLSTDLWGGTLALGTRTETHLGGRIEARVSIGRHIELFAGADLAVPTSAGASRDYARRVFTVGAGLTATSALASAREPPGAEQSPVVAPGRVRFRLRAVAAAQVVVVGSWDGWQTPGRPLPATREVGLYESWVELPAGSHRYHFLVDGQARKPPEAPRYAPDGYGGEDGVVEVPKPQRDTNPEPAPPDPSGE